MPVSLTAAEVAAIKEPGIHRVADNLYLQSKNGGKSWILRYQIAGKPRQMGLGPYKLVPLSKAKEKATKALSGLLDGIDPLEARAANRGARMATAVPSFRVCAERYVADHRAGWKNLKHASQWEATLATYAFPVIGDLPTAEVTVQHIVQILKPIWSSKSETASRLRGRIETVLGFAAAQGYRSGDNPASWKGSLGHLLPPLSRVQKTEHHAATPYAEMPVLFTRLGQLSSTSAKAVMFTALTAARTGETIGATWSEIDLNAAEWIIPAERMKANRSHQVPLSRTAVALLKAITRGGDRPDEYVFAGQRQNRPLSNMAMLQCLQGLRKGETVHGLRAAFSTWAREQTDFPREIVEASLAHSVGNAVEQAYARTTFFEKRRELLTAWDDFLGGATHE